MTTILLGRVRGLLVLAAAVAVFGVVATTQAALLVDNSFTLGLADGTDLNGQAVSATGFTGNYTINNSTQNGSTATETYASTGLSFGDNFHAVSGGAAVLTTTTPNTSNPATARLYATIDATATGTVYSSYLTQLSGSFSAGNYSVASTTAGSLKTWTNRQLVESQWSNAAGVGVGASASTVSFFPQITGTTYLILSRHTNIGVDSAVSQSDLWIFDLTQYDAWVADGADENELATFANKTVSNTSAVGTYSLDGTFNLMNVSGNTSGHSQIVDEFRVGTDLADVTVTVPEPTSLALLGIGATLVGCSRRRRNRR